MSRHSRYNETRSNRVPHQKRTIKLAGSGDDDGKWYRCWYCGFINNIDRNVTGSGEGLSYSVGVIDNDIKGNATKSFMIGNSGTSVILKDGFSERHNIGAYSVSGCSFCGCKNYR